MEIINDSKVLIIMRNNEPEIFINITTEMLSDYLNNMNNPYLTNIIDRITPLYEGNYPKLKKNDTKNFIQLVNDLDYLESNKRIDLFTILHFSPLKSKILRDLNDVINSEYSEVEFKDTFVDTLISLNLFDLLKTKDFVFTDQNFNDACEYGYMPMIKYIWSKGNINLRVDNDIIFKNVCISNKLEVAKYLWQLGLESYQLIDIFINNAIVFKNACEYGNLEMFQWLCKIAKETFDEINFLEDYGDNLFALACRSGNLELVQWIYNLGIEHNVRINIHYNNEEPFKNACRSGNLKLVKWLLLISSSGDEINIHVDDDYPFQMACLSGNLELVQWLCEVLYKYNIVTDVYFGIRDDDDYPFATDTSNEMDSSYEDIFIAACNSGNINVVEYIWNLYIIMKIRINPRKLALLGLHMVNKKNKDIYSFLKRNAY